VAFDAATLWRSPITAMVAAKVEDGYSIFEWLGATFEGECTIAELMEEGLEPITPLSSSELQSKVLNAKVGEHHGQD